MYAPTHISIHMQNQLCPENTPAAPWRQPGGKEPSYPADADGDVSPLGVSHLGIRASEPSQHVTES